MSSSELTATPDGRRWDRSLRALFLTLLLTGLVTGYVTRPRLNSQINTSIGSSTVREVSNVEPDVSLPFLPWNGRALRVTHQIDLADSGHRLDAVSYYVRGGRHMASRSAERPATALQRSTRDIEFSLRQLGETYLQPAANAPNIPLDGFWEHMNRFVDVKRVQSFLLFPARYVPGSDRPVANYDMAGEHVIVLHLWCDPRPVLSSSNPGRTCPTAARIIYSPERDDVLVIDDRI